MIRSWVLICLLAACVSAPPAAPSQLTWLDGCWQTEDGRFKEAWASTQSGITAGLGTVYKDGKAVSGETLIARTAPEFFLEATPNGQDTVRFEGERLSDGEVVFVNADHDYPQKISYRREGDTLLAEISLVDDSKLRRFIYQPCP